MVDIRGWGRNEKLVLWLFFVISLLNFIVGLLALGPDIFSW